MAAGNSVLAVQKAGTRVLPAELILGLRTAAAHGSKNSAMWAKYIKVSTHINQAQLHASALTQHSEPSLIAIPLRAHKCR